MLPCGPHLRSELLDQGVDPDEALLVESYEDGRDEVGAIVSRGRRVLAYRAGNGDWTWADITDWWSSSEFAEQDKLG